MKDEAHKIVVWDFLQRGQRQEAIKYLMQVYDGVDSVEAEKLVQFIEGEQPFPKDPKGQSTSGAGCGGCFSLMLKMISVVFMIMSIGLFVTAGIFYYALRNNQLELVKVDAEVIEKKKSTEPDFVTLKLKYEWKDEEYVDMSNVLVYEDEYNVSDVLRVSINPHRPNQVYLAQETEVDIFDLLENNKSSKLNDLTFVQLFNEIATYVVVWPAVMLFLMSIALWFVSNRITRRAN